LNAAAIEKAAVRRERSSRIRRVVRLIAVQDVGVDSESEFVRFTDFDDAGFDLELRNARADEFDELDGGVESFAGSREEQPFVRDRRGTVAEESRVIPGSTFFCVSAVIAGWSFSNAMMWVACSGSNHSI
jgi:hypothetical protein